MSSPAASGAAQAAALQIREAALLTEGIVVPSMKRGTWVLRAVCTLSRWQALQQCLRASAAAAVRGLPCTADKEW